MSPPSTSGAWAPASERPMRPRGGQPRRLCALNRSAARTTAETIPHSRVSAARAQPLWQHGGLQCLSAERSASPWGSIQCSLSAAALVWTTAPSQAPLYCCHAFSVLAP